MGFFSDKIPLFYEEKIFFKKTKKYVDKNNMS